MVRRVNRVLSSADARKIADFVIILRKLDKEYKAAKGKKRMKPKEEQKARPSPCCALRRARSPTWLGRGPFHLLIHTFTSKSSIDVATYF